MNILLLGKNGQVGWELQRALAPLGNVCALDRQTADLANLDTLRAALRAHPADVIVNAAAYTAVDKAESETDLARRINAEALAVIGEAAQQQQAWMVHYSTDYVFDGSGQRPWQENDPLGPLNQYGRTKLEGEQALAATGCRHLIFRTSWVYAARGGNFAKTMLRLADERDALTVINDQFGAPTGAELIADVTAHAIRTVRNTGAAGEALSGVYHLAAAGEVTWHGYARHVLDFAQRHGVSLKAGAEQVAPVPSTAFPTPAKRPHNSRLDTLKLREAFGLALPDWQCGVERMLSEYLNV